MIETEEYYGGTYPSAPEPKEYDILNPIPEDDDGWYDEDYDLERRLIENEQD